MYKKILTLVLTSFLVGACGAPTTAQKPAQLRTTPTTVEPTITYPTVALPARLTIPAINVDAPVIRVGLAGGGKMGTPTKAGDTGWYEFSPRPGEVGPAIINGHVDTKTGPDVFYRLKELKVGDSITVTDKKNKKYVFKVVEIHQYDKDKLPWDKILGERKKSVLRLITCGGKFDKSTGHYEDNIVVYADRV